MDTIVKWLLLYVFTALLQKAVATGYAYDTYDSYRPLRGHHRATPGNVPYPYNPLLGGPELAGIGSVPHPYNDYPAHPPTNQRGPYTNGYADPLWAQFWDAYNYRGPLEETYGDGNDFFLQESHYQRPQREFYNGGAHPQVGTSREEAYKRYREYFLRRFGNGFRN